MLSLTKVQTKIAQNDKHDLTSLWVLVQFHKFGFYDVQILVFVHFEEFSFLDVDHLEPVWELLDQKKNVLLGFHWKEKKTYVHASFVYIYM